MSDLTIAMDSAETLARVREVLQSLGLLEDSLSENMAPDPDAVGKLPSWVARFGLARAHSSAWLFCETRPDVAADVTGQVVLHFPAGRYLVDAFDVSSASCVSRESASGAPLVLGLPFSRSAILLSIRHLPL